MGWSIGYDEKWKRDIGYGVPAVCDQPDCGESIDRGLSFVCGGEPYGGEYGCGLYFCGQHLLGEVESLPAVGESQTYPVPVCDRCEVAAEPYEPTGDVAVWIAHKLTDKSWARWRAENPDEVARLRANAQPPSPERADER